MDSLHAGTQQQHTFLGSSLSSTSTTSATSSTSPTTTAPSSSSSSLSTGPTASTSVASSSATNSPSMRNWDPLDASYLSQPLTRDCIARVKADLRRAFSDPVPGVCVMPDENDFAKIHALVSGPFETPYEGGFFYFILRCPPDYPLSPPRVRLMTTGRGTVRFNPNLYQNGKVCLSILGTWSGPGWSSTQSISSVLLSIQSLMNSAPYHNEPGFEAERAPGDARHYSDCIKHETFRIAAVGMAEGSACEVDLPEPFRRLVRDGFVEQLDFFENLVTECTHMDGKTMYDPFGAVRGKFKFAETWERATALGQKMAKEIEQEEEEEEEMSEGDGNGL